MQDWSPLIFFSNPVPFFPSGSLFQLLRGSDSCRNFCSLPCLPLFQFSALLLSNRCQGPWRVFKMPFLKRAFTVLRAFVPREAADDGGAARFSTWCTRKRGTGKKLTAPPSLRDIRRNWWMESVSEFRHLSDFIWCKFVWKCEYETCSPSPKSQLSIHFSGSLERSKQRTKQLSWAELIRRNPWKSSELYLGVFFLLCCWPSVLVSNWTRQTSSEHLSYEWRSTSAPLCLHTKAGQTVVSWKPNLVTILQCCFEFPLAVSCLLWNDI